MSEPDKQVEPGEDGEPSEVPVSPETEIDKDEHDEEAEHAETQPDEPIEQPEARSEQEIERAMKALEKENTRHKNNVSKIMGEDAQGLVPCPRCVGLADGLVFPFEVAPIDDAQREAVLVSIGMGQDQSPPLREAEGVEMCPRCDGHGQLVYPTRNPHVQTQMCPRCGGQGYVNKEDSQAQTNVYTPEAWQPNTAGAGANDYALPDSWGRPAGHPHYGRDPVSIGV